MSLHAVILAAGQGTRMRSQHPKVLQTLAGRPLLSHVLSAAAALTPDRLYVVYGHGGEAVRERFRDADLVWVHQAEQLGTGHAVQQAIEQIPEQAIILVLYGDVPLIGRQTLTRLCDVAEHDALAILTVEVPRPAGYGRILRDQRDDVIGIIEEKDASAAQRAITEINTGLLACPASSLSRWLSQLSNDNAQQEYYLTDVVALAVAEGARVEAVTADSETEIQGVNNRGQLAAVERALQWRQAETLMAQGATFVDPSRFDQRGSVQIGRDVVFDVNVVLEGEVAIGDDVWIGPGCVIRDSRIGNGVRIEAYSVLDGADVGNACSVGPFARLRPGARLATAARVGNFVEVKQSDVGEGSKINHLSYVGDARVGCRVNIGAGVITCNYDGANKHVTVIGDDVFVGSNSCLVAPVEVGDGAFIGAGSTVNRNAPGGELTVARARQVRIPGWRRPDRKE